MFEDVNTSVSAPPPPPGAGASPKESSGPARSTPGAPLSVARVAPALAFYNFARTFAQTWGIAISASILQNELRTRLPPAFAARFPAGAEIAYAIIPVIPTLEPTLQGEVRAAFAASMATVWKAMAGFSAAGLVSFFIIREVPMQKHTDEKYGLDDGHQLRDEGGIAEVNALLPLPAESLPNEK